MTKGINFFFVSVVTSTIFTATFSITYPSKMPFLVFEYPALGFKSLGDAVFKAVENVVGQWAMSETLYKLTKHRYPNHHHQHVMDQREEY